MKILVFSDSHAARSFMRLCMERIKPDAFIHLGDYYEDGEAIAEEFPIIACRETAIITAWLSLCLEFFPVTLPGYRFI